MDKNDVKNLSESDQIRVGRRLLAAARSGLKAFNQDEMETKACHIMLDEMEKDIFEDEASHG